MRHPNLAFTCGLVLFAACSSAPSEHASSAGAGGADAGGKSGAGGSDGGTGGADAGGIPCDAIGVSKGPWSLAINGTSAKIRWEACRAGTVPGLSYAPEAGGPTESAKSTETSYVLMNTYKAPLAPEATPDYAGTWYLQEAAITGLAPATCYKYRLDADASRAGRFCTARNSGDALTFMSIGDTNPGIGPYAAGDLEYALPHNPDFTIHGGDLQYYDSGLETWASWFPVMQPMLTQGGFFPAVGNHESETPEEYLAFDMRYFGNAGFDGMEEYWRFESAGVWFFSVDTELSLDIDSPQGSWLVQELEDATTQPGFRFSIVYMHRPLVTCGDTADNPALRDELEPIFLQNHVPIVIQAHMHGYERFEFGDITYLTIAGGGGIIGDPNANVSRSYCGQRVSSGGIRHAAIFDLGTGKIDGTIIDYEGSVFDSFTETVP
jgi:acid phosphatase type 7